MGRIVVGFDGSSASERALDWAVQEAGRWHDEVLAVSVYSPAVGYVAYRPTPSQVRQAKLERTRAEAEAALERAIERVRTEAGAVRINHEVVEAKAEEALLTRSNDADLLVVGSRGRGGFASSSLGSVGRHCVQHARCPVVVVPG